MRQAKTYLIKFGPAYDQLMYELAAVYNKMHDIKVIYINSKFCTLMVETYRTNPNELWFAGTISVDEAKEAEK